MADVILTLAQLENIFQALTAALTGLDADTGVRISWPTPGAPGWAITKDLAFIRVNTVPDGIIQQRETDYQEDAGGVEVKVVASYTRVHLVQWIIYGPNSFENAEKLRNGLYLVETKNTLAASNLHMVLDVPPTGRLPELFNGQWWQRADLSARFNEQVTRYSTVPYIESAGIKIYTENGEVK